MQTLRYRYRAYPTRVQEQALHRLFGCCRVVWNDTLQLSRNAYEWGLRLSSTEMQRQILTLPKQRPEHAWLGKVSSVALIQAHRDAMQAIVNGNRKDREQHHARKRSLKRNPVNSARFTRSGFHVERRGTFLAKIGVVKTKWSRELPSEPSSCTVIHEPSGRWYVSFVVQVKEQEYAPSDRKAAVDLGFKELGSVVYDDGERRRIRNPKELSHRLKTLRRQQRKLARQHKGSNRYEKQKRKIARLYAKANDSRNDYLHKQAHRLLSETQAIGIEDLNVRGMSRKHGRSVGDTGLARFVAMLEYKARLHGRAVEQIGRFQPSTRLCSQCGHHVDGGIPENVRVWQCSQCHAILDRDYNAALNILDAAGLAESLNARGGNVRLRLAQAGRSSSQRNVNPSDDRKAGLGIPVL